jgi:protein-L-isoaspartate(D-aspartate) O-methyltransferase
MPAYLQGPPYFGVTICLRRDRKSGISQEKKGSTLMNLQAQRKRMLERQLIPRGIHDPLVLKAMEKVPREAFVPEDLRESAYGDNPLPIGEGQTISQPYIVALMTEALELKGSEKVLEIGTGSGYQAAVLAETTKEVYTVERVARLSEKAKQILGRLGYANIHFKIFNGTLGWPEHSPYDAIMVTAGAPEIPESLIEQLREGGRLVIPVGDRLGQDLLKIRKTKGKTTTENLGAVRFVSLVGEYGWKEQG